MLSNPVNEKQQQKIFKNQWFFILEKMERICELSNITGDQELQNNGLLYFLKIKF